MKMTPDESAAIALALAALRVQAMPAPDESPRGSRLSAWVAAARLEALRDDV
ncbi:MAG TPA: hypothetical protein VID24_09630 [Candidatus Eremiobacteraceae bacterium]|jgi:hypothetical protein